MDLTHISGASLHNARAITHQLTDVSIRVPGVRRYAVAAMCDVLLAGRLLSASGANNCMSEVLHAAAFVVGEFSEYVAEHVEVIRCMMRREVGGLSGETQNVFVQSVMKVLAAGMYQPYNQQGEDKDVSMEVKVQDLLGRRHVSDESEEKEDEGDEMKEQAEQPTQPQAQAQTQAAASQSEDAEPEQEEEELDENGVKKRKVKAKRRTYQEYCLFVGEMLECLYTHLPLFCHSSHVEVQERAVSYHELVAWIVTHAQMQPFISVNVESRTGASKASSGTNGEEADKAQSNSSTSTALNLLDDGSASAGQRGSSNATLPPATALSSIAIQLCMLFSERLNPVNPKAQRKVPVPKGLDLNQSIHEGWEVDSEASESEAEESEDSDGTDRSSKRRGRQSKDGRRKDKSSRHADGKADKRKKRTGGLYSDDEYNAPLTAAEKAEAKGRLDARKQAQMNDPFYLVDKKAASATSAAATHRDDSGAKSASKDELSDRTAQLDSDKGRKKSGKKHRGGDEDDIFAGVGDSKPKKVYKVQRVEDMPSDALSSDDDTTRQQRRNRHDADDQHRDEAKKKKSSRDDRHKSAHDSRDGSKHDKGGHRHARTKEAEEEKDGQVDDGEGEKRRKTERREKKKDRLEDKAAAIDEFDPMNDSSSRAASDKSEQEDKKKRRKEKERESKRDKDTSKDKERKKEKKRRSEA